MKLQLLKYNICFFLFLVACKQPVPDSIIKQRFKLPVEEKQIFTEQEEKENALSLGRNSVNTTEVNTNISIPIDTITTYYSDTNYLNVYVFEKYDSLEGQPIKSFEVRDKENNIILKNEGDSLFLADGGPDEEHVTIYPLFKINNQGTLQIFVSFAFYPELSCAYTSEIVDRLFIKRPYNYQESTFVSYSFLLNPDTHFYIQKKYFLPLEHIASKTINEIYSDFNELKENKFLPVQNKDILYYDLYFAVLKGDTNHTHEIINSYNNKYDEGDVYYQLTRYLLSF